MKRILKSFTLILSIMFFVCFSVPAFAKANDIAQVTKAFNNYTSAVTQYNKKKIDNCLDDKHFSYSYNLAYQKYIRMLNKKYLTYNIKSIKIRGNSATVMATVSFYSAYDDSKKAMKEVINVKNMSDKKISKLYIKKLKAAYSDNLNYCDSEKFKEQFIFTNTTKIPLVKKNGKWKVAKVTSKMQYQMDCVTSDFWKDVSKNPFIIFD